MDFGVATSTRGALGNRDGYIAVAERAERLGFGFISEIGRASCRERV